MGFPKYADLSNFSTLSDIEDELFLQQKNLFELKVKKTIENKNKQNHLYVYFKRRIAHLQFKKSLFLKTQELKKKQKENS